MNQLFLADLKDLTEQEIKEHLAEEYSGSVSGICSYVANPFTKETLSELLKEFTVLVAYESVGNWGCDSASYFLLQREGKLYEVQGSHCSCFGFEGQFDLQETTIDYLKSDKFYLHTGGYDNESTSNELAIKAYIESNL